MINELLAAAILSTSFSVRTPNDNTKPLDYEFSIKAENNKGNFTLENACCNSNYNKKENFILEILDDCKEQDQK